MDAHSRERQAFQGVVAIGGADREERTRRPKGTVLDRPFSRAKQNTAARGLPRMPRLEQCEYQDVAKLLNEEGFLTRVDGEPMDAEEWLFFARGTGWGDGEVHLHVVARAAYEVEDIATRVRIMDETFALVEPLLLIAGVTASRYLEVEGVPSWQLLKAE